MLKNETLDQRQWIVLFIAGVTLCAIFFALGLVVGRWSAGAAVTTAATPAPDSTLTPDSGSAAPVKAESAVPTDEGATDSTSSPEDVADSTTPGSGTLPSGLEPVENPPGTPTATGSSPAPATGGAAQEQSLDEPKRFYVRAGLPFVKSEEAEELAATLRSRGLVAAFTQPEVTESGQRRFVVLLGPYVDRDSAALTVNALRNESVPNVTIISRP